MRWDYFFNVAHNIYRYHYGTTVLSHFIKELTLFVVRDLGARV
jgi:hypothetical protein